MSGPALPTLLDDLVAEEADLDALLSSLVTAQWDTATPSPGWSVRDQVAHLAFGEDLATLAASDPVAFGARLDVMIGDLAAVEAEQARRARDLDPPALASWWRESAAGTASAVRALPEGVRIAWITGPMSAASFVTARLMETWAHGTDVAAAVGIERAATARLRHVADLGVRTRAFSFHNRGLDVPAAEVRVELDGPSAERWWWGPADAPERVEGPVEDFCLVVCRRRNPADTALRASGPGAAAWLPIAQCFAGESGPDPPRVRA